MHERRGSLVICAITAIALAAISLTSEPGVGAQEPAVRSSPRTAPDVTFSPVMGQSTLYTYNPDGVVITGTLAVGAYETGGEIFDFELSGNLVDVFDITLLEHGWAAINTPEGANVHPQVFNDYKDQSSMAFPAKERSDSTPLAAPVLGMDADLDVTWTGWETNANASVEICGENASGNFMDCQQVGAPAAPGVDTYTFADLVDKCGDQPCTMRPFANDNRLGFNTWGNSGENVVGGTPAQTDDLYTLGGGTSSIYNFDANPTDVDISPLANGTPEQHNLPGFGHNMYTLPADDWYTIAGGNSGGLAAWSYLPPILKRARSDVSEGFTAITAADGGNSRMAVVFPLNSAAVGAEFGAINMGKKRAKLRITYRSATGKKLGKGKATIKSQAFVELKLPGKTKDQIGFVAEIKVKGKKSSVWPYGRLTHSGSGDITIVPGIVLK